MAGKTAGGKGRDVLGALGVTRDPEHHGVGEYVLMKAQHAFAWPAPYLQPGFMGKNKLSCLLKAKAMPFFGQLNKLYISMGYS